jgi:hypothetical protein
LVDRVWARYNNSFDYTVQVAEAIQASTSGVHVASASNEAIISGAVNLADYDAVIWILGNESTTNRTFDATEQTKVEAFIAGGGHLFVTGSEIGWDLDQANNGRSFFEGTLKSNYVADDANTYNVVAPATGIFAGLTFSFDNGSQYYNVSYPDVIAPQAGAISALTYSGGTGGSAGVQVAGTGGRGNIVVFGFPFETITTAANRAAVMDRVLDFFGVGAVTPPTPTGDFNGDGVVDGADFLAWQRGFGAAAPTLAQGDADQNGAVDSADLETWKSQYGNVAAPPTTSFALSGASAEMLAAPDATEEPAAASAVPMSLGWLSQRASTDKARGVAPSLASAKSRLAIQTSALRQIDSVAESMQPRDNRNIELGCSRSTTVAEVVDQAFDDHPLDGDWATLL